MSRGVPAFGTVVDGSDRPDSPDAEVRRPSGATVSGSEGSAVPVGSPDAAVWCRGCGVAFDGVWPPGDVVPGDGAGAVWGAGGACGSWCCCCRCWSEVGRVVSSPVDHRRSVSSGTELLPPVRVGGGPGAADPSVPGVPVADGLRVEKTVSVSGASGRESR